jgi:hypothetical protein
LPDRTIFATATKVKKMMSDFNFNQIPSEIKYFIPGKETVNDIQTLFGSLQKMKIPQVESKTFFSQIFGPIQFVFAILWNIS